MVNVPRPSDDDKVRVREAMADRGLLHEMTRNTQEESVTPSHLYRYASGALSYPNQRLEEALATSPAIRASFRRMVENVAPIHMGQAVAASDGALPERRTDECTIRYEASQAEAGRTYVIIELSENLKETPPEQLVLFAGDGACHQFPLPPARRGLIQLLVEDKAPIITLLSDPVTEVFLR